MASTSTIIISLLLAVTSLFIILAMYSVFVGQNFIEESVGKNSILLADDMAKFIESGFSIKINDVIEFSQTEIVQKKLLESNQEFEGIPNLQDLVNQQDKFWKASPTEIITPFMESLILNELSEQLRKNFTEKINARTGQSVFAEVFLTNAYGVNIAQTSKTTDYIQHDEAWWQNTREHGISIGKTEYDESTKTDIIPIGIKITDKNGEFIGVMKAAISVRSIIREAEVATQYDDTTQVNIITDNGNLIYSTKAFRFNEDVSHESFFEKIEKEKGFFIVENGFKKELVTYTKPSDLEVLGEQDWIIVIRHEIGQSGILSGIITLRNNMIIASSILVGIVFTIGIIFSRNITISVSKLILLAKEIGKGNFDMEINIKGTDEMTLLANSMNTMAKSLQEAEIQKRDFSGMISHELKTPLVPITGYTELLKNPNFGELNDNQKDAINEISQNAVHLNRLLTDIISLNNLESNTLFFKEEKVQVEKITDDLYEFFKSKCLEKNIEFVNSVEKGITAITDFDKLREVIRKMLENSVEFTSKENGRIEISANKQDNEILFFVKDNGIGISEDNKKNLFKRYSQIDKSHTRGHGGVGVSLVICKGFIEGMGGKIWVESEYGKGTTFFFTIPKAD